MKNIIIIQRIVPHYRIPFYNGIYAYLLEKNIKLTVIYGQEKTGTVPKSVFVDEPWAVHIENKYYYLMGKELVWQPCLKLLKEADLRSDINMMIVKIVIEATIGITELLVTTIDSILRALKER